MVRKRKSRSWGDATKHVAKPATAEEILRSLGLSSKEKRKIRRKVQEILFMEEHKKALRERLELKLGALRRVVIKRGSIIATIRVVNFSKGPQVVHDFSRRGAEPGAFIAPRELAPLYGPVNAARRRMQEKLEKIERSQRDYINRSILKARAEAQQQSA